MRHAEVEGHEVWRYNGQSDVPLTSRGLLQYQALLERLMHAKITACYTSDLSRCVLGAEMFANHFRVGVIQKEALREIDVGIWEGMAREEIINRYPKEWKERFENPLHYRVPDGENLLDVASRVTPAMKEIVEKHRGEEVIVVGHGGVNRIILLNAIKASLESLENIAQDYSALNIIDYYINGHTVVKVLNG